MHLIHINLSIGLEIIKFFLCLSIETIRKYVCSSLLRFMQNAQSVMQRKSYFLLVFLFLVFPWFLVFGLSKVFINLTEISYTIIHQ